MKKGDKVKFIHQKLEGVIDQVHSNGLFDIMLSDGFTISAAQGEIIAIDRENDFMLQHIHPKKIRQSIFSEQTHHKKNKKNSIQTVDLHIEKLAKDHKSLKNHQILDIQLSYFTTQLNTAIQQKQKEVICIHGIGKGVLRQQIHELLKGNARVKEFYAINDGGATKIVFGSNKGS